MKALPTSRVHCLDHIIGLANRIDKKQRQGKVHNLERKLWKTYPRGLRCGKY